MKTSDIRMNAPRADANRSSAETLKTLISRLRFFTAPSAYFS